MSDMTEVTAELKQAQALEDQKRAYAEHQALAARVAAANTSNMTIEAMRQVVAQADAMKADADAYTALRKREREAEAREAARLKAEQGAAAAKRNAAETKQYQKVVWVARGLDPDRFEAAWPQIEIELALRDQSDPAAEAVARKLASGQYI